jgi:hypothetical protein
MAPPKLAILIPCPYQNPFSGASVASARLSDQILFSTCYAFRLNFFCFYLYKLMGRANVAGNRKINGNQLQLVRPKSDHFSTKSMRQNHEGTPYGMQDVSRILAFQLSRQHYDSSPYIAGKPGNFLTESPENLDWWFESKSPASFRHWFHTQQNSS